MMLRTPFVRPPRVAIWLVDLFTPDEDAEAIQGDLLEEYSELALKSGVASARRWYWRQSVKTIAHLMGTGFRVAPWSVAGAVVGGFLLLWLGFGFGLPERAILAVLDFRSQPHVHPYYTWPQAQVRVFWLVCGALIGRLLMSLFIGFIVAAGAKGREMVATITLTLIQGVFGAVEFLVWSASHRYAFLLMPVITPFGVSIMIVMGGGIVRKSRSAAARRPSGT